MGVSPAGRCNHGENFHADRVALRVADSMGPGRADDSQTDSATNPNALKTLFKISLPRAFPGN
jgi:hypothetical protein